MTLQRAHRVGLCAAALLTAMLAGGVVHAQAADQPLPADEFGEEAPPADELDALFRELDRTAPGQETPAPAPQVDESVPTDGEAAAGDGDAVVGDGSALPKAAPEMPQLVEDYSAVPPSEIPDDAIVDGQRVFNRVDTETGERFQSRTDLLTGETVEYRIDPETGQLVMPEPEAAVMVPREAYRRQTAARLRTLDKITGRFADMDVVVGVPSVFGSVEVTMMACYDTPPELPPEAAAFLQIRSIKPLTPESMPADVAARLEGLDPDSPEVQRPMIFSGWMYASSPGLMALEHPVYDVWVMNCKAS